MEQFNKLHFHSFKGRVNLIPLCLEYIENHRELIKNANKNWPWTFILREKENSKGHRINVVKQTRQLVFRYEGIEIKLPIFEAKKGDNKHEYSVS